MTKYFTWALLAVSSLVDAASITENPGATQVRGANLAVIPTSAGQIGVNPVDELGPSSTYHGSVAPTDTGLITASAGTTRWLAKHIDYLTEETVAGSTKTVQVVIATATAAADGQSVGDVSIVLAEGLAQALKDSAAAAVKACGAAKLTRRRLQSRADGSSVLSCLVNAAQDATQGGIFNGIEDSTWNSVNIDLASSASAELVALFQVVKTQAIRKKQLIVYMAAAVIAAGGAIELAGKINIPAAGFGASTKQNSDGKCKGLPELGQESPLCIDTDCLGDASGLCTTGEEKDCPCLDVMRVNEPYFWEGVQEMLSDAAALLPSIAAMGDGPGVTQASAITINAPTPTPECKDDKIITSQDFSIRIPTAANLITVQLPIANPPGDWEVKLDKPDSIAFWQIDAGETAFAPINNGNGAPPDGKITWKVPDGFPTANTKMTLQSTEDNLELKATISGSAACKDRGKVAPACLDKTAGDYGLTQHVRTETKSKTPKEILYILREALCNNNNKCENPPDIPTRSVFATADGDGCEISIAVNSAVEAWAYRRTQAKDAQVQDCWESMESIIEQCTSNTLPATGWVNGPDDGEFFQIGFRGLNAEGAKHSTFENGSWLDQYCPDPKPSCDTCNGGGFDNKCLDGEYSYCECEPVSFTQPPPPKVTNCATAAAAAIIACCNRGRAEYKSCQQDILNCQYGAELERFCQSEVTKSRTYGACLQGGEDDKLVSKAQGDDIATCLDVKFSLNAEFQYA